MVISPTQPVHMQLTAAGSLGTYNRGGRYVSSSENHQQTYNNRNLIKVGPILNPIFAAS